jgi:predicted phosphodiesterase
MRIGVVTDIHDDTAKLAAVLDALRADAVDAVVSLGDTSDLYAKCQDVAGVAALLERAGAVGVWGNHDFGLCRDVGDEVRARFPAAALAYLATMRPRLDLGGCHFSHVEPWLDPEKPEDLWCFDGRPEDDDRLARTFAAVPHRVCVMGHVHRWLAATDAGALPWRGEAPLTLDPARRHLVAIAPVFAGAFAVIDTAAGVVEPRRLVN